MNHNDKYTCFEELAQNEGSDYVPLVRDRNSEVAIIAPHGGGIEPGTSEIAEGMARTEYSLYLFEGLKTERNYETLHITSTRFNEPRCLELVERSSIVIAIHGQRNKQEQAVYVGGLALNLRDRVIQALRKADFAAGTNEKYPGTDATNICNKGTSGKGIQLEITAGIRYKMFAEFLTRKGRQKKTDLFYIFADAVRKAITDT